MSGSDEMESSCTPRFAKRSSRCRSTTCCMHPLHPGPMLKYRSTGLPA
jgi:hypothetical protein